MATQTAESGNPQKPLKDLTSMDNPSTQEENTLSMAPCRTRGSRTTNKMKRQQKKVFLTRATVRGKQFRPSSPISNKAAYPIVRYQTSSDFRWIACCLNQLIKFFNVNTIAIFLYDAELQLFIADYRHIHCKGLPYPHFAMHHLFSQYDLNDSRDVNTPINNQTEDGEWVDIENDTDDEIDFPHDGRQRAGRHETT